MTSSETESGGFRSRLRAMFPYLIASFIFICIGIANPLFMVNWVPGVALLLVVVWVIPTLWRRRR